jgi:hypothetical protein
MQKALGWLEFTALKLLTPEGLKNITASASGFTLIPFNKVS